jgi:hypothetical protein
VHRCLIIIIIIPSSHSINAIDPAPHRCLCQSVPSMSSCVHVMSHCYPCSSGAWPPLQVWVDSGCMWLMFGSYCWLSAWQGCICVALCCQHLSSPGLHVGSPAAAACRYGALCSCALHTRHHQVLSSVTSLLDCHAQYRVQLASTGFSAASCGVRLSHSHITTVVTRTVGSLRVLAHDWSSSPC